MTFPTGYTESCFLRLKNTVVATSNQTMALPLLVASLSAVCQAGMNADGSDLRVTLADGTTRIPHDVILDASGNASHLMIYNTWLYGDYTYIRVHWSGDVADDFEAVGSTYGRHACYPSRIGMWPYGGGGDRASYANDGTANGGVTAGGVTGKVGLGTSYDAVNDYFDCGDEADQDVTGDITIVTWASFDNWNNNKQGTIVSKGLHTNGNVNYIFGKHTINELKFTYNDTNYRDVTTSGLALTNGVMHMVGCVARKSAGEVDFYVNGALYQTITDPNGLNYAPGAGNLRLGVNGQGDELLSGVLNQTRVIPSAKSAAWFASLYAAESDLAAAWQDMTPAPGGPLFRGNIFTPARFVA